MAVSSSNLSDPLKAAFFDRLPALKTIAADAKQYNTDFLTKHSNSSAHILGAAQAHVVLSGMSSGPLDPSVRSEIIAILEEMTLPDVPPSITHMMRAVELIKSIGGSEEDIEAFERKCKGRVPLAAVFASKEEIAAKKQEAVNGTNAVNGEKADV